MPIYSLVSLNISSSSFGVDIGRFGFNMALRTALSLSLIPVVIFPTKLDGTEQIFKPESIEKLK